MKNGLTQRPNEQWASNGLTLDENCMDEGTDAGLDRRNDHNERMNNAWMNDDTKT
jgi:hypothetical protein